MVRNMDMYWVMEYGKVFCAYLFLMFIWPTVVFGKFLKKRSRIFYFSFCVTVQVVIVNTVVLIMGLFHILDGRLAAGLFYGVFLFALFHRRREFRERLSGCSVKKFQDLWKKIQPQLGEFIILFTMTAFGMAYFSYGAFQIHSYGQFDVFLHHEWVDGLMEGKVFSDGVYPYAMHCFIYCLSVLFGIRLYSIMLFLQCIHVAVFLLSAYCLLREIFRWRYSPFFVLGLYLTLDFTFYHSMSRLQATLPMEFGLYTQFLCGLFLIRYIKSEDKIMIGDSNLLLLMMALAASITIHYYTTIMAFILCASIVLFHIKKVFCPRYFFPLALSVVLGCLIAIVPAAGGLASGIPFEGSIAWAVNSMGTMDQRDKEESPEREDGDGTSLELSEEDLKTVEKLPAMGQTIMKGIIKAEYLIKAVYQRGYKVMYWDGEGGKRGNRIWFLSLGIAALCLAGRIKGNKDIKETVNRYFSIILVSFFSMLIFIAYDSPDLGLPVLVADHRYVSTGHLMVLAVMVIPADFLFWIAARCYKESRLQTVSCIGVACIYIFTNLFDVFHGYLFYVMFRYDVAAEVTNSIMSEFPKGSYTVVSPREELYQLACYGEHKDISDFIMDCDSDYFSLPTEYVFIYVEKKPIVFFQYYYLNGPSWLAKSANSTIETTEITEEAAKEEGSPIEDRTVLESSAYEWCCSFAQRHPSVMETYYEDDGFVCYYFRQSPEKPYNLSFGG